MMKRQQEHKMRMVPGTYYVWVAGSCDYGHEERCSGGAYVMEKDGELIEKFVIADDHTTEFRMILSVMIHAMETLPESADIVFLTNVSYIQQNYDKEPTDKSSNAELISACRLWKARHSSVNVKLLPYHKYHQLPYAHELAHEAMIDHRNN